MATIKSYTDIEQSRKLAEILPLESADMHYNNVSIKGINYVDEHRAELMEYNRAIKVLSKYTINPLFEVVPCWSLAALIDVLPYPSLHKTFSGWRCDIYNEKGYILQLGDIADKPVDACYEMIIKLYELKML